LQLFEQLRDGMLILRPNGRLDTTTSVDFGKDLINKVETGSSNIVIDFSDLDYISSAGLRTLLMAVKLMESKKRQLSLCSLNSQVQEVFDVSGFSGIFTLHTDIEQACQA